MLVNLFALVLIYTIFFVVIIGSGIFFNIFFFKQQKLSLGETGIYGFINIYFLVLVTHFFASINQLVTISTGLFFIILFALNISRIFNKKNLSNKVLLFVFIIFLTLSITNNHHDDLYIFQLPIINYMQNHKVVFGLINLNDYIGQGHALYEIMSYFKVPFYGNRTYFIIPIIFVHFFVLYLLENFDKKNDNIVNYLIFFIISLLIIRFNRSKEYGTDLPILCLLFFVQLNFYKFLYDQKIIYFYKSTLAILFAIVLKLYSILSIFYLLPFIFLLKKNILNLFKKKAFLFFLFSIFFLTIVKNLIVSGCAIYPIKQVCFSKEIAPWSIGKEIANERNKFYSAQVMGWKSYVRNNPDKGFVKAEDYLKIPLIEKYKSLFKDKDIEKILTGIILLVIFISISFNKSIKFEFLKIKKIDKIIILFFLIIPLLIWIIKLPQSRYGFFAYISYFVLSALFLFGKLSSINLKLIKITSVVLLSFLITKNANRIITEIKNNNIIKNQYPIKNFRISNYDTFKLNGFNINVPTNGVLECANIPMFCASFLESINNIQKQNNYIFIYNNIDGLIKHLNKSAYHDMIEMNSEVK